MAGDKCMCQNACYYYYVHPTGPLLQGQMRIAKLKSAYNSLIIGRRGLGW